MIILMIIYDGHEKSARCCKICDYLTDGQKDMLAAPTYKICKDNKSGILWKPPTLKVCRLYRLLRRPAGPQLGAFNYMSVKDLTRSG